MPKPAKENFAKQLAELEAIADWFEAEEVGLDQALAKFERGMELAAQLEKHISTAKNKVEQIKNKFEKSVPKSDAADDPELFTG